MNIILLTHERELERPSNTGALALAVSEGELIHRVVWSRVNPNAALLAVLRRSDAALVYPASEINLGASADQTPTEGLGDIPIDECETFVLLDATWQEARKIYNRSPYLQDARRVGLTPAAPSQYQLRRNQKVGGLSTAESVIEILRAKGRESLAELIESEFLRFNSSG